MTPSALWTEESRPAASAVPTLAHAWSKGAAVIVLLPAIQLQPIYGPGLCLTARCLWLWDVRSSGGSHLPPAADAGSAVVADNQPQSVERLEFL
jgi:hypothetical protein